MRSTNLNTRDWPTPLRLNDAAIQLAPMLYYQAARVYGGGFLWDALPLETRRMYITRACEALQKCQPHRLTLVKP